MLDKESIVFDHFAEEIILSLVVSFLYAFLLYRKEKRWSPLLNKILFGLRFSVVFLLALLLCNPLFKKIHNTIEKPYFLFVLDNSLSIPLATDSVKTHLLEKELNDISLFMEKKGFQVLKRTLQNKNIENFHPVAYTHTITDYSTLMSEWNTEFENHHIEGILFASDGIYNAGASPEYIPFPSKIYTVGVGDTIPKKDVILSQVLSNKIVYKNNLFPLKIEILNQEMEGSSVVQIFHDGKEIKTQTVLFVPHKKFSVIEMNLPAQESGLQEYTIFIKPLLGEVSTTNNTSKIYIDVLDKKQKILIAASSPHPDIKAIKSAIEKNENYEITTYIPTIHNTPPDGLFDIMILHNPFENQKKLYTLLEFAKKQKLPLWYILGSNTLWEEFHTAGSIIKIKKIRNDIDYISPHLNENFAPFLLNNTVREKIHTYFIPIAVPYIDIIMEEKYNTLLSQKIGSITNNKPLWLFSEDRIPKQCIFLGENLWMWRIQELAQTQNAEAFDELILKTIQYISTKEDKRPLRVYPLKNEMSDNEIITLQTEVYNSLYEPIYDKEILIKIKKQGEKEKKYSFTTSPSQTQFVLKPLPEGIYFFTAQTEINGKTLTEKGKFVIKTYQKESNSLTADFQVLKNIAHNTGGKFYYPSQFTQIQKDLEQIKSTPHIFSQEELKPLIDWEWILLIALALLSIEWFTRKYLGGY